MSSVPYTVITADAHAGASIATYREYLDARHQKLFDEWRGSYRNPQKKHIGSKKQKNWDDEIRLGDMDQEGVAGEVIFPNTVPPFFRTSALIAPNPSPETFALRLEGMRAHNRWLVDFQNAHPHRRAGIGLVYLNDIDEAIKDVEWIAKNGLKGGILLPQVPPDDTAHILPLYAPEYERFWAACQDCDVVVNQHGGTGSPGYGEYPIALPIRVQEVMFFSTRSYGHLLLSGVFHRFPKLRYIITEAGCAWVPSRLEELDRVWQRVRAGALGEFQFDQDAVSPEPPSFYAKRNCWYGASAASPREIADRDVVGVDRICWGTDYPHYEGTYPHTRAALRYTFHDLDESEVRLMVGENAASLYRFDLEALRPVADAIGPMPEAVATPLAPSDVPVDTMTMAFRS
ncbi:MAG: amidohydrolase family protein [Myxococcota bacterium]